MADCLLSQRKLIGAVVTLGSTHSGLADPMSTQYLSQIKCQNQVIESAMAKNKPIK